MKQIQYQQLLICLLSMISIALSIAILLSDMSILHPGTEQADRPEAETSDTENSEEMCTSDASFESSWYNEVTCEKRHYDNNNTGERCDYYVACIPLHDEEGRVIPVTEEYDADLTPSEHAKAYNTTLTINGNSAIKLSGGGYDYGLVISDGTVIHKLTDAFLEEIANGYMHDNYLYVCIMKDRSVREYPVNSVLSSRKFEYLGVQQCFIVYFKLVEDGRVIEWPADRYPYTGSGNAGYDVPNPRMAIGIDADNNMYILCCEGRTETDTGLSCRNLANLMADLGCVEAWNLDGGGSASLSFHGEKQNRHIDNGGTAERKITRTLNVGRKPAQEEPVD